MPPWRPNCSSMWSKNGMPVAAVPRPGPSRSSTTRTLVSRVSLCFSERRIEDLEKAVVLLGCPDGDTQTSFEAGPGREVADQHRLVEESLPQAETIAIARTHEEEVGARRPHLNGGRTGQ